MNALLIDDSSTMRSILKTILRMIKNFKFNFFEASEGSNALKIISDNNIEIIFCDVNMPGMNGIELLKAIRTNEQTLSIPFVFITSKGRESLENQIKDYSIDGIVSKPFVPEDIKQSLERILQ